MALRLPIPTRNVRRATRARSLLTIGFAAVVFTVLPLRLLLAAIGIAEWTSTWGTVNLLSTPFVVPLRLISPLKTELFRNVTAADIGALLLFGGLAIYLLTLLTVRRRRS